MSFIFGVEMNISIEVGTNQKDQDRWWKMTIKTMRVTWKYRNPGILQPRKKRKNLKIIMEMMVKRIIKILIKLIVMMVEKT